MNILVTGGAGFIGSHVVDLIDKKHNVLIVDNLSTGRMDNITQALGIGNVRLSLDDIRDRRLITNTMRSFSPDIVIHLAAQAAITTAEANPVLDLDVNARGTLNLLKISEESQVKQFIYASTSAVYAENTSGVATREDHKLAPENYYGISKMAGEMYTRIAKIPTTILRFGNVYGPRQIPIGDNQVIPKMIKHILFGDEFFIFGDGEQERDFIYVEDLATAILSSVEFATGTYNVSSGYPHSINLLALKVAIHAGKHNYQWKYDLKRADHRRKSWLDITRATRSLNWEPVHTLDRGLKETIAWWITQHD